MHNRRLWVCVFLFTLTTINYTDRVALSVAAKPVAVEFGLTPVELGYLFSSFLWMYIVCLIPVGLLVDRFGGKRVNARGIALWSAATVLTGFSFNFWSMASTRIVMGMGEATSWPACNRIIREWFPASERAFANAVFGAGSAAGPAASDPGSGVTAASVPTGDSVLAAVRERIADDLDAPGALAAVDRWASAVTSAPAAPLGTAASAELIRDTVDALLGVAL